ncbi:PH domain-containing protein [Nonomuraea rubra]|uniref:PH domain-containing protein n=1 Tax=Nonomuraea rubra TaxID=46180 RepID=UPI003616FC51
MTEPRPGDPAPGPPDGGWAPPTPLPPAGGEPPAGPASPVQGAPPPGPGGPYPGPGGPFPWPPPAGRAPQRLSPKVLLIDPVRMLPSLLLPLVGVLFVGGFSARSYAYAAVGVLAAVVFATVRWATFTYEIVGDRLETKRSLISRSVRTIPLERIRGVDVSNPPMHRLLGLTILKIDTGASGDEEEAKLAGVSLNEAERLKALLLRRTAEPAEDAHTPHTTTDRPIIGVPRKWLLYGPLSGAYLLTPFAFVGGAIGLAFQWGDDLGLSQDDALSAGEWLWGHPYLLVGVAVLLVLAMPFAGGLMYAVFNWDFVLKRRDGYLVAERGLINRRSVSLESKRVRGYEIVDGLVERWAGVVRVWAIVTGLGDSETRGQLLPDVPRTVAFQVTGDAIGPYDAPLRPHPPVARRRRLFRAVFPWLVLAAASAAGLWATGSAFWWVLLVLALLLAGGGVPLGLDRYASLGHGYDGGRLAVRSGSLRRAQAVVERRAVVGWRLRQTWFQRQSGVLTLIAGVGAGKGGLFGDRRRRGAGGGVRRGGDARVAGAVPGARRALTGLAGCNGL